MREPHGKQEMRRVERQPGDVLAPLKANNPEWTQQISDALRTARA